MDTDMSPRLAISTAFSILTMAAYVLFYTPPSDVSLGAASNGSSVQAAAMEPVNAARETLLGAVR